MYMCYFVSYSCCTLKHVCSTSVFMGCLPKPDRDSARLLFFSQNCIIISYRECFHSCFCPPPFPLVYQWLLSWIVLITQLQSVFHSIQILYIYMHTIINFSTVYQSSLEYKVAFNSNNTLQYSISCFILEWESLYFTSKCLKYISYYY